MSCRSPALSDLAGGSLLGGSLLGGSLLGRRPTQHRYICTKVLLAEGGETPFTEHCRNYENSYRSLQGDIQGLKDRVQELHRDLTKHHSVINAATMGEVLERSLGIDRLIAAQHAAVDTMRLLFEEIWDETFQRVSNEQEIYEAQLHDLLQLKQENCYLTTIARQISPYIHSIAKVQERLEPRFKEPGDLHDNRTERMLQIYEDSGAETGEKPESGPQTLLMIRDRPDRTPPSVTPAAETPASVTPASVTPASVTPASVTPASVTPASVTPPSGVPGPEESPVRTSDPKGRSGPNGTAQPPP